MKYLHTYVLAFIVVGLLVFAHGCATDTVTKTNAATSVAIGTGTGIVTFGTGLLTGGWSWIVGVAAGFVSLFFGKAPPPGAVSGPSVPWFWIGLALFLFFKGEHLFNLVFRGGGLDSVLRFLTVKRTIIPKRKAPVI